MLPDPRSEPADIDAFLADVKTRVDRHLEAFFRGKRARAAALSPPSVELVDALEELTMRGGKRTRPAVLVAGSLAVAGDCDRARLLDACAGLELLQSYLLVHDDWMDQDDERRGGTTLHRVFADRTGNRHLGACLAVLVGDLGNAFAIELVAGSPMAAAQREQAMRVFWEMQQDVVLGQALDLIAYSDVALIQRLKTGSYSVKGPLLLGATIAGASPALLEALTGYADPVGEAFQVRDDLLGTFGAPEKTGKPAGNDLRAGKRTALVEEAEKRLATGDLAPLHTVWGRAEATDAQVASAMALLERSGAKRAVESRIEALCQRADAALDQAALQEPGRTLLRRLARKFAFRDA